MILILRAMAPLRIPHHFLLIFVHITVKSSMNYHKASDRSNKQALSKKISLVSAAYYCPLPKLRKPSLLTEKDRFCGGNESLTLTTNSPTPNTGILWTLIVYPEDG